MTSKSVRQLTWKALVIAAAVTPMATLAQAKEGLGDGLYAGSLNCGPAGSSPAFSQAVSLALRDGTAEWSDGKAGQDGYHVSTLTITADGTAHVEGYYLVGAEKRPTNLTGRVEARSIAATGRRGPRDCHLELVRPPASGAQSPYRLPYDIAAIRARSQNLQPGRPCPQPSNPPVDLLVDGFYRLDDPTHSQIDPQRLAAYNAAMKPIRSFEAAVSAMGDQSLRTSSTDANPSDCIVSLLDNWASADALLGRVSPQGAYERKWSAITYAFAFMETRSGAPADRASRIAQWLRRIGDRVAVYYMQAPSGTISDRANNHAYWAALSSVAAGMAAQDSDLFDWGMARFIAALNDVDAGGYLKLELARGSKAMHYHRFSLEPLLLVGLIARANNVAIPAEGGNALIRLVHRVQSGLDDPRPFAERSGRPQDEAGRTRGDWAWAELALAMFDDADLAARIAPLRPLSSRWLGGDLTLRYAGH